MIAIDSPVPQFFDLEGEPLQDGYIYFGIANQNPETAPITVYWDAAGTQPVAQPVRTINGVVVRAGTPANLFINSDYSVTVKDKKSRLVIHEDLVAQFSDSAASLRNLLASSIGSTMIGRGAGTVETSLVALEAADVRLNAIEPTGRPYRAAYLEQHLSGFFGRGMLTAEAINVTTEQAFAAGLAAGGVTVVMTNATNIVVGSCVSIKHDNGKYGTYFVDSKSTNNIGIRPALRYDCLTANARIERTWYNRAHPGKFYMRELAQRIANTLEVDASMPQGERLLYCSFDSNPNTLEDTLISVGGAAISYFPASDLGESGDASTPVRFALGRTAFVDGFAAAGAGVETQFFDVSGVSSAVVKIAFFAQLPGTTFMVRVINELGREVGKYSIPAGANQRLMRVYTVPCDVRSANKIKVQVLCETFSSACYFTVDMIDVFEAPDCSSKIISNPGAKIVCLGDSWMAGDLVSTPEREPIPVQLALELPYATIINSGVGGNTIANMLARFDTDVAAYNPDYVVIDTGTNEAYNPLSAIFDPNAINAFIDLYKVFLNKVAAIGARPIIIGVPALAQSDADVPAFPEWQLNDRSKAYAKAVFDDMGRKPLVSSDAGEVINADGTAIKFADGTMICRHTKSLATVGALTLALTTWNFPVSFVAAPKVTVAVSNYATSQLLSCGTDTTSASATVIKLVSGTGAFASTIDCIAVGRWKP